MQKYILCLVTVLIFGVAGKANPRNTSGKGHGNKKAHQAFNFQLDAIAKRLTYADPIAQKYVEKYIKATKLRKNGRLVPNPHYNGAFAQIIYRLATADLLFQFEFNPNTSTGQGGYIRYDGTKVSIVFGDAGLAYGGGIDHILFEETKHAEQVLDGQVFFVDHDQNGTWGVVSSIQAEVNAKLFVIDQLGYAMTYFDTNKNLDIPTQLGILAKKRNNLQEMCCFLKYGAKNITILGEFTVNIPGAYPDFSMTPLIYYQRKMKTPTLLAYPYRKP